MKVTQQETEFKPVVITLESQEEVDIIADLLALAANHSVCEEDIEQQDHKLLAEEMYKRIDDLASDSFQLAIFEVPDNPLKYK